ncbi:metal-dependent DNase [[Clostridium] ultunense Esp]|nr:metal-dependent DNase [[Clostridium] ultunense Esp]
MVNDANSLKTEGNDPEMLFDTHAHLNAEEFDQDREEVLRKAKEAGVDRILNIGYNRDSIPSSLQLAEKYDYIYSTVGWHPQDAHDFAERDLAWLGELTQHPKVVAIGEIGLDYYWDTSPREVQQKVFRAQIALAKERKLPIVIHDRDAHEDLLRILKEEKADEVGGIMHAFSGSIEMAKECIRLGFYISFGGPITFKNAVRPKEVAKMIPLEWILIETDSPYLTPHPYRGKRNESGYVRLVAEKLAELRGLTVEEIEEITYRNAVNALHLKE